MKGYIRVITKVHNSPSTKSRVIGVMPVGRLVEVRRTQSAEGLVWAAYGNTGWFVLAKNGVQTMKAVPERD